MSRAVERGVMPTVFLTDALPEDRRQIDADAVELRGSVLRIDPWDDADQLIVPMERLAGIEGGEIERAVDTIPTQGGQYSEVVTKIS